MSYTQTQVNALKAAAARGVLSVTTDGNTVTYVSISEMRKQIAIMEREIAAQSSARVAHVNPIYSKGI